MDGDCVVGLCEGWRSWTRRDAADHGGQGRRAALRSKRGRLSRSSAAAPAAGRSAPLPALPRSGLVPARVAGLIRDHWRIEVLCRVAGVPLAGDASRLGAGNAFRVMAVWCGLAIGALWWVGMTGIAVVCAARRPAARIARWFCSDSGDHETGVRRLRRSPVGLEVNGGSLLCLAEVREAVPGLGCHLFWSGVRGTQALQGGVDHRAGEAGGEGALSVQPALT